jgi:hypothetical protein
VQGKRARRNENLSHGVLKMYEKDNGQISLSEFYSPFGKLDANNRWVRIADMSMAFFCMNISRRLRVLLRRFVKLPHCLFLPFPNPKILVIVGF